MKRQRRKEIQPYREFAFQIRGRDAALGVESCEDGTIQIGLSITLIDDLEAIGSQEIDVILVSGQGNAYNCWWRPPEGILPVVQFGFSRTAFAGYRFKPIIENENPESVKVLFQGSVFELDLENEQYRSDLDIPEPPAGFPVAAVAEYDRKVEEGRRKKEEIVVSAYERYCGLHGKSFAKAQIQGVLTVLRDSSGGLDLALVAQREFIGSPGIVRGEVNPETGQLIDYTTGAQGEVLSGALDRQGTLTYQEHIDAFLKENEKKQVIGWMGNGNLLMNRHFVTYLGEGKSKGFYYVAGEELSWDGNEPWTGRTYSSLVAWKDKKYSIEELIYLPTKRRRGKISDVEIWRVKSSDDDDNARPTELEKIQPKDIRFSTYGQWLVRDGKAVTFKQLCDLAERGEFYDFNHLLVMPWVPTQFPDPSKRGFIQVGYHAFWNRGRADLKLLRRAMEGKLMDAQLDSPVFDEQLGFKTYGEFEEAVRDKLKSRGYVETRDPNPSHCGEYSIRHRWLTLCYRPGAYLHNLVGITKSGQLVSFQVTVREGSQTLHNVGGTAAPTLMGVARFMVKMCKKWLNDPLQDAILLDNGGDVMLCDWTTTPPSFHVESEVSPPRSQLRSLLLFVADKDTAAKTAFPDVWVTASMDEKDFFKKEEILGQPSYVIQ